MGSHNSASPEKMADGSKALYTGSNERLSSPASVGIWLGNLQWKHTLGLAWQQVLPFHMCLGAEQDASGITGSQAWSSAICASISHRWSERSELLCALRVSRWALTYWWCFQWFEELHVVVRWMQFYREATVKHDFLLTFCRPCVSPPTHRLCSYHRHHGNERWRVILVKLKESHSSIFFSDRQLWYDGIVTCSITRMTGQPTGKRHLVNNFVSRFLLLEGSMIIHGKTFSQFGPHRKSPPTTNPHPQA